MLLCATRTLVNLCLRTIWTDSQASPQTQEAPGTQARPALSVASTAGACLDVAVAGAYY